MEVAAENDLQIGARFGSWAQENNIIDCLSANNVHL